MSNVAIRVAAEFVGKKAFKDAGKATSNLEKQVSKLGKQMLAVFSVTAVTAFGKASVKAFLEAEKANTRLAAVVDNLGLAFAQAGIQKNLDDISAKAGIAGELLVDAFQPLLTTTGSVIKSQELLALALDVSAGSGKDIVEVSKDLALAYTGVTRGLRKYNLGLTQAELKAADFNKVQGLLSKQFSGAQSKYLATYAGQMQVLTEAAGNAQEIIGVGLVDALTILAGKDASIQGVADSMANVATEVANVTRGLALMVDKVKSINILGGVISALGQTLAATPIGLLLSKASQMGSAKQSTGFSFAGSPAEATQRKRDAEAAAKAEAAAAKRAKELAKLTKNNTAELKKQALAKKQSALFDLDQIQLVAALQGKLTKEEKLRVDLQLALLTGNTDQAKKLADQLADSIDKTGKLKDFINTIPDAPNPFKGWDEWLKNFTKNMAAVTGSSIPTTAGAITPPPSTNVPTPSSSNRAFVEGPAAAAAYAASQIGRGISDSAATARGANIVVQIDGKTIASALQDQSLSGVPANTNRLLGHFSR